MCYKGFPDPILPFVLVQVKNELDWWRDRDLEMHLLPSFFEFRDVFIQVFILTYHM